MLIPLAAADTTILAAFAIGFVSFISPCVLPLVPGYLSAISGSSIAEIRAGEKRLSRILLPALIFCLSFTVMFVALGMTATGIGSTLRDHQQTLNTIAGVMIILLGIFFMATPFVTRLNKDWHPEVLITRAGAGGPVVAGLAFAVAWTPCVGPTLAAILAAASTADSVGQGGLLLFFYSLGLAIPFLLMAMAFDKATVAFSWLRDHYLAITFISGTILILMGILILTDELTRLNSEAQQLLNSLGLDFFYTI
ncbi:MAG: cytochrome c biogenesis protein CcdA [Actinomycetes bacterium]